MKWIYAARCRSRAVPGALLWSKSGSILPKGGNHLCFSLLWCNKELCCICRFCKINYCSGVFCLFFFSSQAGEEPCSGLFMGSAVLEDNPRCMPRPGFGWARCEGEANQGPWTPQSNCTQWLPQQWGWQPPAPLALVGAAPEPGWVGTSSPASAQVGGCFWGLHHIPGGGGSTCHSQPWEDMINWLS